MSYSKSSGLSLAYMWVAFASFTVAALLGLYQTIERIDLIPGLKSPELYFAVDAGLDDYYRHRTDDAVTANQPVIPDFLERVSLYDRPEIQKGFVRQQPDGCEAFLLVDCAASKLATQCDCGTDCNLSLCAGFGNTGNYRSGV